MLSELAKSAGRFSWAMLLLGARQAGAVLSGRGEEAAKSAGAVARAAEERLGSGLRALSRAGERLQSAGVGVFFDALAPRPAGASALAPAAFGLTRGTAGALGELLPGDAALPWLELEAKLEAFELFKYARERLGISTASAGEGTPLAAQLTRISHARLDTYRAVWVTEGLGYAHAADALRAREEPRNLLSGALAAGVPAAALVALHAGMGLAFAERSLAPASSATSAPNQAGGSPILEAALARFFALCRNNAMSGYEEVASEALGLVARTLHPRQVAPIARRLAAMSGSDAPLAELFWHGVGRGAYFALDHALPWPVEGGPARRALADLEQEAPGPDGRNNALAGFAWALALVNIRRPEVVESFLLQLDQLEGGRSSRAGLGSASAASEDAAAAACANGIAAAILVWYGTVGDDAWLARFLAHASDPADRRAATLWRRQVKEPCETVLEAARRDLGRSVRWGSLFRYRPLAAMLAGREAAR